MQGHAFVVHNITLDFIHLYVDTVLNTTINVCECNSSIPQIQIQAKGVLLPL